MGETVLGIIGGSGLYEIEGFEEARRVAIDTPFGKPSDEIRSGRIGDIEVHFLPRHGRGHVFSPSDVPYRANIAAFKMLGVTDVISLSACGSFREEMAPGDFVIIDQFIDRTRARPASFFGRGCVAHVSMARPVCPRLGDVLEAAARSAGIRVHRGGTYLAMEGPQFSTIAESRLYRERFGADVIGMTNMPEARLAREAELCYATVAMVTDYDSWHEGHGTVDVAEIVRTLSTNAEKGRGLVKRLAALLPGERRPCPHGCDRALDDAILTAPSMRDPELVERLVPIAGRVLGG